MLLLQNKQLTALNQRQIATALARTRKGESLDDQLFKLERQFQALGQALENRAAWPVPVK